MGHGMLDSRNDRPTASSKGFGATTTTTRGVSRVKLMMMMEWNWFHKLKRSKKIPQRSPESMFGAMPETFGGEYNCLFGDSLWEDPHCCTTYTQAKSLDKEAEEEDMHLFAPTVALVQQMWWLVRLLLMTVLSFDEFSC